MTAVVDRPFSLTTGPIGGTCDNCPEGALHEYWRDGKITMFCGDCACQALHEDQPAPSGPLWCPGCDAWVQAP